VIRSSHIHTYTNTDLVSRSFYGSYNNIINYEGERIVFTFYDINVLKRSEVFFHTNIFLCKKNTQEFSCHFLPHDVTIFNMQLEGFKCERWAFNDIAPNSISIRFPKLMTLVDISDSDWVSRVIYHRFFAANPNLAVKFFYPVFWKNWGQKYKKCGLIIFAKYRWWTWCIRKLKIKFKRLNNIS